MKFFSKKILYYIKRLNIIVSGNSSSFYSQNMYTSKFQKILYLFISGFIYQRVRALFPFLLCSINSAVFCIYQVYKDCLVLSSLSLQLINKFYSEEPFSLGSTCWLIFYRDFYFMRYPVIDSVLLFDFLEYLDRQVNRSLNSKYSAFFALATYLLCCIYEIRTNNLFFFFLLRCISIYV